MTEKQAFSVFVRAIGLLTLFTGASTLWFGWAERIAPFPGVDIVFGARTIYALAAIVLGASMIRWRQWVVYLAWLERLPTIGRMPDAEEQPNPDRN